MQKIIKIEQWLKMGDHPDIKQYLGLDGNCETCDVSVSVHGWINLFVKYPHEKNKRLLQRAICPGDYVLTVDGEVIKILSSVEVNSFITKMYYARQICSIKYCSNNNNGICHSFICGRVLL